MAIAVVSDVPEHVQSNGALLRARGIVSGLQAQGHNASLVRVRGASRGGLYRRHRSLASHENLCELPEVQESSGVILCGIALAHAVNSIRHAPVVVDVCDSLVEAWGRRIIGGDMRALAGFVNVLRLVRLARHSACVTYVTDQDLRHDRSLWFAARTPIRILGNGVDDSLCAVEPVQEFHGLIGFVGDMSYGSNKVALGWILREVWPAITCLGWRLAIFGPTPPDVGLPSGVEYAGYQPSLADVYRNLDVTLAPSLDGAGFKNKVAESLAACRPVVTTPLGARGQVRTPGLLIEDNAAGFIARLSELTPEKVVALSQRMSEERLVRSWASTVGGVSSIFGRETDRG